MSRAPALGLAAAAVLAAACSGREPSTAPVQPPAVEVLIAAEQPVAPEYRTFGTVVFSAKADVFPSTEGRIERILVEEGTEVASGQLLAEIERTRLLIEREQAQAEVGSRQALLHLAEQKLAEGARQVEARLIAVSNAEAEVAQRRAECDRVSAVLENKRRLFEIQGVSREELEAARTEYLDARTRLVQAEGALQIQRIGFREEDLAAAVEVVPTDPAERRRLLIATNTGTLEAERRVAEAQLQAARSRLKTIELLLAETAVRSPVSGIVGSRYSDPGERATPDRPLFTILCTDRVDVQVDVGEQDLPRISLGQEARVEVEDVSGRRELAGRVRLVAPYVSPDTRSVRVKIAVDNPGRSLPPGLFARVVILTGPPRRAILLPRETVIADQNGSPCVFLVRGGRLYRQGVQTESHGEASVVVLSGLREGDRVVREPSVALREGMEVEVR